MIEANYTPLPWRAVNCEKTGHITVQSDEYFVADVDMIGDGAAPHVEANAAFIVTACNAHNDMLVALEYAYHILGCVYDGKPCDVGSALQPCDDAITLAKAGG